MRGNKTKGKRRNEMKRMIGKERKKKGNMPLLFLVCV